VHISADDLIDALRNGGLRVTASRLAVCRVIARSHAEHLTAAAITASLSGTADQSTVYRTLEALETAGVLTHTHLGHGPSVYHLADETPHQHLVCERCGVAVEIETGHLTEALAVVTATTGFVVDSGHFALSGLCRRCASG
jgi:Fe2+ or Zn2+ uptake regulation protein